MEIALVYIFAILFPIAVGFLIYRSIKKYNNQSSESQKNLKTIKKIKD